MGKYAVSIGVNYTTSPEHALKGCVNDTYIMRSILIAKGFHSDNIIMLNDEDPDAYPPSGANVRKALDWLCTDRTDDDVVFLNFSGHGTQIPAGSSDGDDHEEDGKDEAICLENLFLYADDDFKMHFTKLPKGCQATVVTDCCHSGGMLDHTEVAIAGDKKDDGDDGNCARDIEIPDSENRSLPISSVASFLSKQLGGKDVSPTASGIGGAQANFFGGDAGKLAMKFAAAQMSGTRGAAGENPLAALLGGGKGGGGGGAGGAAMAMAGMAAAAFASGGSPLDAILKELGLGGVKSATSEGAPPYVPTENPLSDDTGILITGCQSNQTSADVRPAGGKPHGALSNAIKVCYNKNPDMSYRELVLSVRSYLQGSGFSQNPQLECSQGNADRPFICSGGGVTDESDEKFSVGGPKLSGMNRGGGEPGSSSSPTKDAPGGSGGLSSLFKACFKS